MYRVEMGSIALIVDDDMTTSIEVGISETYVEVIGKEKIAAMVAKIQDAVEEVITLGL